jgi:glutamyl-tRNA reductase
MPAMTVLSLGLNHTTASVDLRGRFAFAVDQLTPVLRTLHQRFQSAPHAPQPEVALLSTCNRTELYCAAGGIGASHQGLLHASADWLASVGSVSREELMRHAYVLEGGQAARHAFRVASGLDSMVLGEPRRHPGHHPAPTVPAQLCRGQRGAHRHRNRRALHLHGRRRRAPGQPAV